MEMAASVAGNGIQKEQTQNIRVDAEEVVSSGCGKAFDRRKHRLASKARMAKLKRLAETEEERKVRLAKSAERARLRRLFETEEEKRARLARDAERARVRRLAETEEEKKARLAREAERIKIQRREQKQKSEHLAMDTEMLNKSEPTRSQMDPDKCEEGQEGLQTSETSSEQIAPSTSNKTADELELRQKDPTPMRLDESGHRKARLVREAERVKTRRREQKQKSEHLAMGTEMLNKIEPTRSQMDPDKCEEGQEGLQTSETSSEQIAPSTSNKTADELELRQKDPTPMRLDESGHRKARLAKVIDKVKLVKLKEIDQQIKKCYARIAEVIGTDRLIEISQSKKNTEGEAKEHISPSSAALSGNKVSEPFAHTQDSVLHSLLFVPDEALSPEDPLQHGRKHEAGSDQQLVPAHDADAIGSTQLLPAEPGIDGDVEENEGRLSRYSQSPDIIIIKEIVRAPDKTSTPIPHQRPVSDDKRDQGETEVSLSDAEQSSDNERESRSARHTRRQRLRRWAETEEKRKARLAREAERVRLKRLAETEEQKRERLAKAAQNAKLWRIRAREQKKEGAAERES